MAASTTSLVLFDPQDASPEVRTVAGFLAGYSGRTREAYTLDLRTFYRWCDQHRLGLFEVTRTQIELYARELEALGRAPATIGRRLSTLAGFYRYATEEGVIEHSPAVHVRRPRLDYESHAVGLDRNELGAFLVAAGLSSSRNNALCSLLAMNGLRISEALDADIDQLGLERGHRTLVVHRKGGKTVTISLAPRTARAVDLAIGDRLGGPLFLGSGGDRMTRDAAAADGATDRQGSRDHQAHRTAQLAPLVHHGRPGRRRPPWRRPRGRIARRSEDDDALRPRPPVPRPARHLHRRHLRRRIQPR